MEQLQDGAIARKITPKSQVNIPITNYFVTPILITENISINATAGLTSFLFGSKNEVIT